MNQVNSLFFKTPAGGYAIGFPRASSCTCMNGDKNLAVKNFMIVFSVRNVGGLMVGPGFEAVGQNESATITLLDYQHVQELRGNFADGAMVYDKVGKAVRIRSNGEAETL